MNISRTNGPEEMESVCLRCDRCCYEKIDFEGAIYYTAIPCQFLDIETSTCRVYAERDSKRPGCIRLTPESIKKGFLPADCPYVADIEDYPAPNLLDDKENEES